MECLLQEWLSVFRNIVRTSLGFRKQALPTVRKLFAINIDSI